MADYITEHDVPSDYVRRDDVIDNAGSYVSVGTLISIANNGLVKLSDIEPHIEEAVPLSAAIGIAAADVRESVRYGDGWIECDKQLPPDGQLVIGAVCTTDIICMEDGETLEDALKRTEREAAKHPRVEPCWYGEDGSCDPESVGWYGYDGFPMVCHPRYWMQLPKPPVVEVK